MAFFTPLMKTRLRRIFLAYFTLSSLLPLLIILCVVYQYVCPSLSSQQVLDLTETFTRGISAVFLVQLLSFFIMFRWIRQMEDLAGDIRRRSPPGKDEPLDENEIVAIHKAFDSLLDGLEELSAPDGAA